MIFDLVIQKIEKINSITMIDIDSEDINLIHKIQIEAPTYKEIDGTYVVWKYSTHGYVWRKDNKEKNLAYFLFYMKNDQIYIYKYDKMIHSCEIKQIASCKITEKYGEEIYNWVVFDNVLMKMLKNNNIKLSIKS